MKLINQIRKPLGIIDDAVHAHRSPPGQNPIRAVRFVYAMFSGGHDSLVATWIASQHPLFAGVIHLNTGIGVAETRQFVRAVCRNHHWPLFEVRALEDCGQDYVQLVLQFGFPGPSHHYKMYHRLKGRGLEFFFRHHISMPHRAVLVSGRRFQESKRRRHIMAAAHPHERKLRRVWAAVIHDWSALQVTEFIADHPTLHRNPVVDALHMSGECLCGAYAHPGELKQLELWYPNSAAELRRLEARVRAAGHNWGWEDRPPNCRQSSKAQVLCSSCHYHQVQGR